MLTYIAPQIISFQPWLTYKFVFVLKINKKYMYFYFLFLKEIKLLTEY